MGLRDMNGFENAYPNPPLKCLAKKQNLKNNFSGKAKNTKKIMCFQ